MKIGMWLMTAAMIVALGIAHTDTQAKSAQAATSADAENDAQQALLWEARHLIDAGKRAEAIATIDKVLAYYEAKYPEGKQRWFVARDPQESLAYMLIAAADMDKGTDKRSASALVNWWSEAYYLKGYTLVELGQPGKAKEAFENAIRLSPYNSQYLSELGNFYLTEKNWQKAMEFDNKADDAAAFSLADQKVSDSTRAKRGLGYALVELNRIDEAEAKYKECLALDANDKKAQQELDYVRSLKAKNKK